MVRTLNYIFAALLAGVAIFAVPPGERFYIYVGLVASFIVGSWSLVLGWLTRGGAVSAMIIGTAVFGLGNGPAVVALLFFFVSGVLISVDSGSENGMVRRDGRQVWANGFWMTGWVIIAWLTNQSFFYLPAMAAIAGATADTWASELGSRRFDVKTYDALSWRPVSAGSEGGVSGAGLIASLAGSGIVGAIELGYSQHLSWFLAIWIAGFAGALFDSYLGASIQGTEQKLRSAFRDRQLNISVDNNMVNAIATGFGSLLILITKHIFT